MAKCNSCHKSTNSKLRKIHCKYCQAYYHIKCTCLRDLSEAEGEHEKTSWLCLNCLTSIFPYNHLDDDTFDLSIFEMVNGTVNYDIDRLSSLSFNALFKNFKTKCFQDLDPDTKFYDEIDCNYYLADQFNDALETFAVAD